MDDDDDDQMLLNLTDSSSEKFKVRGNIDVKCKKRKISPNKNQRKFQVISSLFRNNPDIPHISSDLLESDTGCSTKDHTFSGSEFKHLGLAPFLISNLEQNLHITKMTSVQKASLPLLIEGKDMFIKSPTGTGKTLAYVIPIIQSLQAITPKIKRIDGPYCVVLVPTRELAFQSFTVVQQIVKPFIWIVPGCVTGGEKRKSEKARLRKGMNVLIATPGRLVDHLKTTQCLKMTNLRWLILDEADRILDLGFEQELSFILSTIKNQACQKVQKVLLSATLSQGVERLADITLDKPVAVNMTGKDPISVDGDLCCSHQNEYHTPNQLKQFCAVVPMKLRLVTLAAFLKKNYKKRCKVIVFFMTQDSVEFHHRLFSSTLTTQKGEKMMLMKLHGKLTQQERIKSFLDFSKSDVGVLLCTDVGARGLDLPSVNWIVQYNPPVSTADYVHRVGRTARIGSTGQSLLFLLPTEVGFLKLLSQHKLRFNEMKMDCILDVLSPNHSFQSSKVSDKEPFHEVTTSLHMIFEETLYDVNNKGLKELAQTAFRSFIGAYNTFPLTLKPVFHVRNLHLGHLAKSFALRETPTELKTTNSKRMRSQMDTKTSKKELKRRQNVTSEIGSDELLNGPLTKKSKKRKKKSFHN